MTWDDLPIIIRPPGGVENRYLMFELGKNLMTAAKKGSTMDFFPDGISIIESEIQALHSERESR
jgi:hypothetical protein